MRYLIFLICIAFSLFAQSERPCNPALLLQGQQPEVILSSEITTEGRAKNLSGKISVPLGLYQSVGLSATDQFKRSGLDGTVLTGHYAINPFATFDFGASVSYLTYRDRYRHHNGTMSLGMNYRFPLHPVAGEHHLGLSGRNLFAVPHEAVPDLIDPTSIMLGWNGKIWDQRLQFSADIGADILDKSLLYQTKFEFRPSIFTMGVEKSTDAWSVSTGVSLLNTDVAVSYNEYESEKRVELAVSRRFGSNRENFFAQLMGQTCCTPTGDKWVIGLRQYHRKEYLSAISTFGSLITRYPDYFQVPMAYYYIARCFQELDSREVAMGNAFRTLSEHPASKAVPYAELLLLKLSVDDRSVEMADEYYRQLTSKSISDSVLIAANYHMGIVYMQVGEFEIAEKYFTSIPDSASEYEKAKQELEILAYLRANDLMYPALDSLCDADTYYKARAEFAEYSLIYNELIFTHESRYIIDQKAMYKQKLTELSKKMMQYRQLIEDEKNRILKLVEESQ